MRIFLRAGCFPAIRAAANSRQTDRHPSQRSQPQLFPMTRLILLAALGYVGYRVAKRFVRTMPDNFEPVGLLPAPPLAIAAPAEGEQAEGRSCLGG